MSTKAKSETMTKSEIVDYQNKIAKRDEVVSVDVFEGRDMDGFLAPATQSSIEAAVAEADYVAPKYIKIREGMHLRAILVAKVKRELADTATGEVKEVNAYVVALPDNQKVRGWILGAYELDQALEGIPEGGTHEISVFRGPDEQLDGRGGRRVTRYVVTSRKVG